MTEDDAERVEYWHNPLLPDGPWRREPHRIEFQHAGRPCIMRRGFGGNWCGYVALAPDHPLYGQRPDGVRGFDRPLDYHRACDLAGGICHDKPEPVWWLGFHCAYADPSHCDLIPRDTELAEILRAHLVYRDVAEVRGMVEQLAERLAEIAQ